MRFIFRNARVVCIAIEKKLRITNSSETYIYAFFSTHHSAYVDNDKIENYQENRAKYVAKYKSSAFANAVEQMDKFISDPIVR